MIGYRLCRLKLVEPTASPIASPPAIASAYAATTSSSANRIAPRISGSGSTCVNSALTMEEGGATTIVSPVSRSHSSHTSTSPARISTRAHTTLTPRADRFRVVALIVSLATLTSVTPHAVFERRDQRIQRQRRQDHEHDPRIHARGLHQFGGQRNVASHA